MITQLTGTAAAALVLLMACSFGRTDEEGGVAAVSVTPPAPAATAAGGGAAAPAPSAVAPAADAAVPSSAAPAPSAGVPAPSAAPAPVDAPPVPQDAGGSSAPSPPRPSLSGPIEAPPAPVRPANTPGPWPGSQLLSFPALEDEARTDARRLSLVLRGERRDFAGAPPVLGHSAEFGGRGGSCLDCHQEGRRIGRRVARPMSHPPYAHCLQCHIEGDFSAFVGPSGVPAPPNAFAGEPEAGPGGRAHEAAPPTMPHGQALRGQCLSCHGEFGYEGLRTAHPRRTQCTQCHVPSARSREDGRQALPWR